MPSVLCQREESQEFDGPCVECWQPTTLSRISVYCGDCRAYRSAAARKATSLVNQAIRRGDLVRADACSRCQRTGVEIQAHHADYAEPFLIEWFCKRCHGREHARFNREFIERLASLEVA